jgi:sterol 24-C-methyltransferase
VFATYEWCLTPKYNPKDEEHRLIKKKIEEGDGLPDMATQEECVQALRDVGFEVRFSSLPPPCCSTVAEREDAKKDA